MVRAPALTPDERRRALVEATIPLLRQHGRAVTTRQIAQAAGVAEGTIFRVFATKDELLDAALLAAVDPAPVSTAIRAIDRALPLRGRLYAAAEVLEAAFRSVFELMVVLRMSEPPGARPLREHKHDVVDALRAQLVDALTEVVGDDAGRLRVSVAQLAAYLRLLMMAANHDRLTGGTPPTAHEVVDLVLDGVAEEHPCP